MSETKVGKIKVGFSTTAPATETAVDLEASYNAGDYTFPADCEVTNIGELDHYWETQENEPSICHVNGKLVTPYKTLEKMSGFTLDFKYAKGDPAQALVIANKNSSGDTLWVVLEYEGGTDRVYLSLQFTRAKITHGGAADIVKLVTEAFFNIRPIAN